MNALHDLFDDDIVLTRVVNMRKKKDGTFERFDVKIDRSSKWGNPFSHLPNTKARWKVATREEAIQRHREWFVTQPELMAQLEELRGKVLGCWCKPKDCHGDLYVELLHTSRCV